MAIKYSGIEISTDVMKLKLMDMSDNVGSNEPASAFLTSKGWQRGKNKVGKTAETYTRAVKVIKCYKCKRTGH